MFPPVLQNAEIRAKFQTMGLEPGGGTAHNLGNMVRMESAKWATTIKEANITAQ